MRGVYLDCHATTPVDPRVVEAMLPYFTEHFGNAASQTHAFGWAAAGAVQEARTKIARSIGARDPLQIVFTSGATESCNLAVRGAALAHARSGATSRGHIITTAIEHRAVLESCQALSFEGFEVTPIPVGASGIVDPGDIRSAVRSDTILVSVMAANNEIGTLQPLAEIGAFLRERSILLHTDAAQALGKVPLHVDDMDVDLMSITAHKCYGPKGVGALYVRRLPKRAHLMPQVHGGGHELGLRSGTLNVPGIVGFGVASELAVEEAQSEGRRVRALRDRLWHRVQGLGEVSLNGDVERRLPGNLNVLVRGVRSDALLARMPTMAISSGSACSSAQPAPSHVLLAIGLSAEEASCSIRVGIGRFNTEEDIDAFAGELEKQVARLRGNAPASSPDPRAG